MLDLFQAETATGVLRYATKRLQHFFASTSWRKNLPLEMKADRRLLPNTKGTVKRLFNKEDNIIETARSWKLNLTIISKKF
ncbi:unnamed protein product [Cylicocyclus nassatus]|uniref:Uncharacterized protein n=1 Tax=Cylicocyclus nassatus TaxID=53992 RepID=A0AA36H8X3_CYLNA|nr:unnamed protein product [Cylicocyclus nassatus]